jgi:Domain of unknown function (DUF4357)
MSDLDTPLGRTIQLYLVDGAPTGLRIATIHGWTGQVLVASQTAFRAMLKRNEAERTGVYVLFGPDSSGTGKVRVYIGEADLVAQRIAQSANQRDFWETALIVTTSDDALTKGDVRYLEARMIELATQFGRVVLDNGNAPSADQKRLPESGKANMEAFLANLRVILPVIGLEMLRPGATQIVANTPSSPIIDEDERVKFEIKHRSGVIAEAIQKDGDFIVFAGSQVLKDTGFIQQSYRLLKDSLIQDGTLISGEDGTSFWRFAKDCAFSSPSAAAAVVLDRNSNGRTEWRVKGTRRTYADWQTNTGIVL